MMRRQVRYEGKAAVVLHHQVLGALEENMRVRMKQSVTNATKSTLMKRLFPSFNDCCKILIPR
jgi:hypothetical protein